jgi:hypothetical protein
MAICVLFELAFRTGQPHDLNRLYRIPPPLLRQLIASSRNFQRTVDRTFIQIDERLAATAREHAAGAAGVAAYRDREGEPT